MLSQASLPNFPPTTQTPPQNPKHSQNRLQHKESLMDWDSLMDLLGAQNKKEGQEDVLYYRLVGTSGRRSETTHFNGGILDSLYFLSSS